MRSLQSHPLGYASPLRQSHARRRRRLVVGWAIGLTSISLTIAGIALADPAGSRLGVHGISHLRENVAVLLAWVGVAMAIAGMIVFRIMRDRAGLGVCTMLSVAETIVALVVSLS